MTYLLYDLNAPTELHTDASSVAIAGIILQKSSDKWHAVSYFNRKTNPTEMKYHSYELEMLAVVASVERKGGFIHLGALSGG